MNIRAACSTGVMLALLCGCATIKPPAQPEIVSNTVVDGKGVPWGRSDSSEDFTRLTEVASDPTYGLTEANPVKVGGLSERAESAYLNGLRGPRGEPIEYERMGSCCPFKTPNAMVGNIGLLDAFRVTYAGQASPSILYVDFYDDDALKVPVGFTARTD
jgi:hypothetical protein